MNVVPPPRLETILKSVEAASEQKELQAAIVQLRDVFKIDHLVYHWVSANGDQYGVGTYDHAWVARYLEKDYLRIDPVI